MREICMPYYEKEAYRKNAQFMIIIIYKFIDLMDIK